MDEADEVAALSIRFINRQLGVPAQFASKAHDEIASMIRALVARERAAAAEALEPFAKEADTYDPDEGDGGDRLWGQTKLRVNDLRRARAFLAAIRSLPLPDAAPEPQED